MKKYFLLILILLMPTGAWGTTWYGCGANSANIDDASFWEDAVGCDGNILTWNNQVAGDIFEANGKTGIVVRVDPKGTGGSAGKVHLKTTAGGGFSITAAGTYTVTADITAGTTDCLTINGTANAIVATVLGDITGSAATANAEGLVLGGSNLTATIGSSGTPVTITGGAAHGVLDNHTGSGKTTTVYATINGGTATNIAGYVANAASGTVNVIGTSNGGAATTNVRGLYKSNAATVSLDGDCVGGSVLGSEGCHNAGTGGSFTVKNCTGGSDDGAGCRGFGTYPITVTGNITSTATAMGVTGAIVWSPTAATNFFKVIGDGTPAAYYLTSNVAGGAHPAVTDVKDGVTYGWDGSSAAYEGTLESSGGGGASAW